MHPSPLSALLSRASGPISSQQAKPHRTAKAGPREKPGSPERDHSIHTCTSCPKRATATAAPTTIYRRAMADPLELCAPSSWRPLSSRRKTRFGGLIRGGVFRMSLLRLMGMARRVGRLVSGALSRKVKRRFDMPYDIILYYLVSLVFQ